MFDNRPEIETIKQAIPGTNFEVSDLTCESNEKSISMDAPIKLLLVDDNPEVIDVICEFLSFAGFFITPCQNGSEAIALLESSDFDVMVTDIQMPYLNGVELLEWMQANCPHTPVGIISGDVTFAEDFLLDKGASFFLEKPFDLKLLVDEIHKVRNGQNK